MQMPTYGSQPSPSVYFKKSQMNKLVVTFPMLTMQSTPTELEASELAEGLFLSY